MCWIRKDPEKPGEFYFILFYFILFYFILFYFILLFYFYFYFYFYFILFYFIFQYFIFLKDIFAYRNQGESWLPVFERAWGAGLNEMESTYPGMFSRLLMASLAFTYETERERQKHGHRKKQAPCRKPDVGLDPRTPGSCPEPKADAQPLSHPGIPSWGYFQWCEMIKHFYMTMGMV